MLHERKSRGRKSFLLGRPPRGTLPQLYAFWFHCLLFVTAVSASSCSKDKPSTTEPQLQADSISITLLPSWQVAMASLDLFIYDDSGIRPLLYHKGVTGACKSLKAPNPGADFIAVAIANTPGRINPEALGSFDAMENLSMSYSSELAEAPLMSGMAQAKGGSSLSIRLTPLLCAVQLESIDNLLEGRPLLRNPRVYFRYANASAQVLRQDGFRPSQTVESPQGLRSPELFCAYLGQDIGYFRREPGISLYCYPNDSPFATIGTPRTELILEAECEGETLGFATGLPALPRGSITHAHVVADDKHLIFCKNPGN